MAIPFFEPKNSETEPMAVDQVDGPGSASTAPVYVPMSGFNDSPTAATDNGYTTNADTETEQMIAWKMLAVTMCKALKEHYEQMSTSPTPLTNAVIQIIPKSHTQQNSN